MENILPHSCGVPSVLGNPLQYRTALGEQIGTSYSCPTSDLCRDLDP